MHPPKALILLATGTNRDRDVAYALEAAGAQACIYPLNVLRTEAISWSDFQILVLPGGFSYADALGAGKLLALDLVAFFASEAQEFIEQGKPVIGICNGFQALVRSGILPGKTLLDAPVKATLTHNAAGHFECRWVNLQPTSQACLWTAGLSEPIQCPVAHGEGRFLLGDETQVDSLFQGDQVAFRYLTADGILAGGRYPDNPNGSLLDIAGISNLRGNVLGLMPHPENHVIQAQNHQRTRGIQTGTGLNLFINGVRYAKEK